LLYKFYYVAFSGAQYSAQSASSQYGQMTSQYSSGTAQQSTYGGQAQQSQAYAQSSINMASKPTAKVSG